MPRTLVATLIFSLATGMSAAQAQSPQPVQAGAHAGGTLVIVPAQGEVKHPNDEARVTFMVEEQDKDKAAAASRVNLKMKQGTELLRRADQAAVLQTRGYYTYPVYADEPMQPRQAGKPRQLLGWRVGQYLDMKTADLDRLPATVASAQKLMALNGLQFGLSEASRKKLDEQRIAAAWQNFTERTAAIARAMGKNPADATIETVDFEGSGAYDGRAEVAMAASARAMKADQVEEPSFEPGETTLGTRLVGKIRFR